MKNFEIDYNKNVYFGLYFFEDCKLIIDEVHTFSEDGEKIEIDSFNDSEIFNRLYSLAEKMFNDELNEEIEERESERLISKGERLFEERNQK